MAAKTKKFKSNAPGVVTVVVPGHSVHTVEPDGEVETSDPVAIAAFAANPDLSEVKGKK